MEQVFGQRYFPIISPFHTQYLKQGINVIWVNKQFLAFGRLADHREAVYTAECLRKPFSSGNAVNLFQEFGWKLKGVWLRVGIHTLERCYVASSTVLCGFNKYT